MKQYIKPGIARSVKFGTPLPRFELTESQIEKIKNISEIVLAVSAIAGAVMLMAVAPNCFQLLDKVPWFKKTYRSRDTKRKDQQRKVVKSIYYLKSRGYIELVPKGEDFQMTLTQKGRKKIQKMQFKNLRIYHHQGKWNGHWWIVIADVPKDLRHREDYLRTKLKEMKFYPLQRTVWVYPFDPRDEVDFVSAYYRIDRFVTMMEVIHIDPADEEIVKAFFQSAGIL